MKKPTCMIIEDEKPAQRILENYIQRTGMFDLQGVFDHVVDALPVLEHKTPDLLILDIRMPGINGLEFARSYHSKSTIIFTTAYSDHAVEGFDLGVTDYLLKPFSFERFLTAVQRFFEKRRASKPGTGPEQEEAVHQAVLVIKTTKGLEKINIAEIEYLQSYGNYLKIVCGSTFSIVRQTMNQMIELLPTGHFIRINKSYSAAINKITSVNKRNVTVASQQLPIGKRYSDNLMKVWRAFGVENK